MQHNPNPGRPQEFLPNVVLPLLNDEESAARWRRVVLDLSENFSVAAAKHPRLAPFLLEALGNALEQLLLFGRERDLTVLDEWLGEQRSG